MCMCVDTRQWSPFLLGIVYKLLIVLPILLSRIFLACYLVADTIGFWTVKKRSDFYCTTPNTYRGVASNQARFGSISHCSWRLVALSCIRYTLAYLPDSIDLFHVRGFSTPFVTSHSNRVSVEMVLCGCACASGVVTGRRVLVDHIGSDVGPNCRLYTHPMLRLSGYLQRPRSSSLQCTPHIHIPVCTV